MLYSLFFKKYQGDLTPFDSVSFVKKVIERCNNPFVIGWPGYISKTTSTLDDFYNGLNPNTYQLHGFFFKPMFEIKVKGSITNEQYLNNLFGSHSLPQPRLLDHSKILVILDFDDNDKYEERIINRDYIVRAILIGSSNQSTNTYFVGPAPKGEADVLFVDIDNSLINDNDATLLNQYFEINTFGNDNPREENNIIATKQIFGENYYSLKIMVDKLLDFNNEDNSEE